jgi:heat shock protein HtpX
LHTFAEAYLARAIAFCDNNVMFAGSKSAPNTATSINQTTSLSLKRGKPVKRIFLFLATNIAVLVVISIILSVLGVSSNPDEMGSLLVYSAVIGFTGSIISLLTSKMVAKRAVGAEVITQPRNEVEAWLLHTVENQARQWNLKTPEVAIYNSPEPNAFATGPSKNNSLVAVSTGLINSMTRDEVEAVLAHEMAHVGNGDMVTLTLIQGVVNTFVVFLARIVSGMVARNDNGEVSQGTYFIVSLVLQIVFGFLASFIVMWFSRQREYRADAGAAKLVGAPKMIAALQRLKGAPSDLPKEMTAMGIASEAKDSLLSTHPTLDNRIERLKQMSGHPSAPNHNLGRLSQHLHRFLALLKLGFQHRRQHIIEIPPPLGQHKRTAGTAQNHRLPR